MDNVAVTCDDKSLFINQSQATVASKTVSGIQHQGLMLDSWMRSELDH